MRAYGRGERRKERVKGKPTHEIENNDFQNFHESTDESHTNVGAHNPRHHDKMSWNRGAVRLAIEARPKEIHLVLRRLVRMLRFDELPVLRICKTRAGLA